MRQNLSQILPHHLGPSFRNYSGVCTSCCNATAAIKFAGKRVAKSVVVTNWITLISRVSPSLSTLTKQGFTCRPGVHCCWWFRWWIWIGTVVIMTWRVQVCVQHNPVWCCIVDCQLPNTASPFDDSLFYAAHGVSGLVPLARLVHHRRQWRSPRTTCRATCFDDSHDYATC